MLSCSVTLLRSDFIVKSLVPNCPDLLHLSPGEGGLLPEAAAPHHSLHPSRGPQWFLEGAALRPHPGVFQLLFQKCSGRQSIHYTTQLRLWCVQMRNKIILKKLLMFFFIVIAHICCFCDNCLFLQSPKLPAKVCTTRRLCAPCLLLLTIWDTTRDRWKLTGLWCHPFGFDYLFLILGTQSWDQEVNVGYEIPSGSFWDQWLLIAYLALFVMGNLKTAVVNG